MAKRGRRGPAPTKGSGDKRQEGGLAEGRHRNHRFRYRSTLGPRPTSEELQRDEEARIRVGVDDPAVLAVDLDDTILKVDADPSGWKFYCTYFDSQGAVRGRYFLAKDVDLAIDIWLEYKDSIMRQGTAAESNMPSQGAMLGKVAPGAREPERTKPPEAVLGEVQGSVQVETRDGPVSFVLPAYEAPDVSDHVRGRGYSQEVVAYAGELWRLNGYPQARVLAKILEEATKVSIPPRTVDKWVNDCLAELYVGVGGGDIDEFADAIGWDKDLVRKRLAMASGPQYATEKAVGDESVATRQEPDDSEAGEFMTGECLSRSPSEGVPDMADASSSPKATEQADRLEKGGDGPSPSAFDDACMVVCEGHEPLFFKKHGSAQLYVMHANDALGILGYDERLEIAEIDWRE